MSPRPLNAYAQADKHALDGRLLEGRAFAKAARLLQDAADDSDRLRALSYNQKLWTTVQAAVTDTACTLPDDIRANLLSLSMFMDRITGDILDGKATFSTAAMVDVNRSMAVAQLS